MFLMLLQTLRMLSARVAVEERGQRTFYFLNTLINVGRRYLPAFCGERYTAATLALVEPGALFDVHSLHTNAEPKGEGYVLSGSKSFEFLWAWPSHPAEKSSHSSKSTQKPRRIRPETLARVGSL